ncbi:MAG: bifunctional alpha,alpha-trehalose-phosphate synthase (UDP-forming)/trehalose-phosphatase [Gemmatimonadetes bacterium]|nr:bifunctional alpha,alpha-trehalose-phosphate synthase (UDP-forming)/trehalose-phosphatase [Gemmatimonadota bacterium]
MTTLLVSNRLPVTLHRSADGPTLTDSLGGVATGLAGMHAAGDGRWIGWPGLTTSLSPEDLASVQRQLAARRLVPVRLDRAEMRGFYQGESNSVIWPLFHYLVQQVPLFPRYWGAYESVSRRFAEVIAAEAAPADQVWVHDYQLMRVPALLRELRPELTIGFFLHIPFPAYEVFRLLPKRRLLLQGVLGADLIGFHAAAYAEHFSECVTRLLGVETVEEGRFDYQGRSPRTGVFPMGISLARFEASAPEGPFGGERRAADAAGAGKTLVAIDRLDYTKGIPRRLLAYEELLRQHPELRERVTLVQVAVPSRTGVKAYRRFRRHVDAMVGRINGTFGTPSWTPVNYLYQGFTQEELLTLYRMADVMLVTPVRDGMNLVAKEFIASRVDGDGVLVLSEFTGAADDLVEAVQVNPYDIEEAAEAYHRALVMRRLERRMRMRALRARVRANPVERWAESFLAALRASASLPRELVRGRSGEEQVGHALGRMLAAESLLLLLDYDGTLTPFASRPEQATPDGDLLDLLAALAARPRTEVHLVSGRQREVLDAWFLGLAIGLHAEHGFWSRPPGAAEWERHQAVRTVPYDDLLHLLKGYTERTPGALIERKSAGLAWHFRLAHHDVGAAAAAALVEEVGRRFPPEVVEVLHGQKVVEFRPAGINKGLIVTRLRTTTTGKPLIVAIGDDTTDEDMFAALLPEEIGVHVGPGPSGAPLRLADVSACRALLRRLVVEE